MIKTGSMSGVMRVLVVATVCILAHCAGEGGGGISVGTSLEPPGAKPTGKDTPSYLILGVLSQSLTPLAPGFAPFASLAAPVTEVSTVLVGVARVTVEYAATCASPERQEKSWSGPFTLSLTDGTMLPELAPLPVSHGVEICRLLLRWNGGQPHRPEYGPPSLYVTGSLSDGRPLRLFTSRTAEFEIRPALTMQVTAEVQAVNLDLPFAGWLASLDPTILVTGGDGVVEVSDDTNDTVQDLIEARFRNYTTIDKGESCTLTHSSFGKTDASGLCDDEDSRPDKDHPDDDPEKTEDPQDAPGD